MKIHAFVKPKEEVDFIYDDNTISEVLTKMEIHRYTSIPIINREGSYVGTLTEGDLLWHIKKTPHFDLNKVEKMKVSSVKRQRDYEAIHIEANIDELIIKASNENFVPVLNDQNLFIGIVTRKTLLNYFFEHNFIVL
jgi:CBS domain-containing protein